MSGIGRRLQKVEAAFAPSVTDELRQKIEGILATAPIPSARDLLDLLLEWDCLPPEVDQSQILPENWRAFARERRKRSCDPRERVEIAERLASTRRRMYAHEHGQEALDAWDRARA